MRLIPIAGFCGAGKSLATLRLALQMQQNGESVCICLDRENPITRALVEEYKIKAFTGKPEEIQGYENVICECYGLDTGNKAKLMATGCQVAPMTVVVDPARLHMMAAYGAMTLNSRAYNDIIAAQLKEGGAQNGKGRRDAAKFAGFAVARGGAGRYNRGEAW